MEHATDIHRAPFTIFTQMISPRLPLTASQRVLTIFKTSSGNGPFLIMSTVSRICWVLLAPRIIPSSSLKTEWCAIQRMEISMGVRSWALASILNFLMAECRSSAPKRACANFPRGLSSPKRVPACSLLINLPVKNPEARGLGRGTVSSSLLSWKMAKKLKEVVPPT